MSFSSTVVDRRKSLKIFRRLTMLLFFTTEIGDMRACPCAKLLISSAMFSVSQQFHHCNYLGTIFKLFNILHLQRLNLAGGWRFVEGLIQALFLLLSIASFWEFWNQHAKKVSHLASTNKFKSLIVSYCWIIIYRSRWLSWPWKPFMAFIWIYPNLFCYLS